MYFEAKNIIFKYKNSKKNVINNFEIEIEKGEIVAILGESGSGKSTLLRIFSGFEIPQKGKLKINGKVLFDDKIFILPEKRGIGMVFQDYALFPHMTVEQNIKFGLTNIRKGDIEKRFKEIIELVSLEGFEKRYPYELSGGQQQRVALGRSLAPNPDLLLLDEPFSNLDANLQNKIRKHLKSIIKSTNTTSIFVSHDKDDPLEIADKVIILQDGKIVQFGEPHKILDHPENKYVSNLFKK